jgi:hypothetical protein
VQKQFNQMRFTFEFGGHGRSLGAKISGFGGLWH